MKKIAALGLAALVGASALAATAGSASAMPPGAPMWNHHYYPHHNGYPYWNRGPGWGWGGPFLFGLGVGTVYGNAYDNRYGWDDHVRWCASRYRTYSPRSDTFFIRPGVAVRCVTPFDR